MFGQEVDQKTQELGGYVQESKARVGEATRAIEDNDKSISDYMRRRDATGREIEILENTDNLNAELQHRLIDLRTTKKAHELTIDDLKSKTLSLNHNLKLHNEHFTTAKVDFDNHKRVEESSLTHEDMKEIETTDYFKMSRQRKIELSKKVGGPMKLMKMMKMV